MTPILTVLKETLEIEQEKLTAGSRYGNSKLISTTNALIKAVDRLERISRETRFVSGDGYKQSPVAFLAETALAEISAIIAGKGE